MRNLDAIIIHHSATEDGKTLNYGGIEDTHRRKGYDGPGYEIIVEFVRDRVVAIFGRPFAQGGAHCWQHSMNRRSIGICVVGNFDETEPTQETYEVLARVCNDLCEAFNIHYSNIYPHKMFANYKTCPGKKFSMEKLLKEIMKCRGKAQPAV